MKIWFASIVLPCICICFVQGRYDHGHDHDWSESRTHRAVERTNAAVGRTRTNKKQVDADTNTMLEWSLGFRDMHRATNERSMSFSLSMSMSMSMSMPMSMPMPMPMPMVVPVVPSGATTTMPTGAPIDVPSSGTGTGAPILPPSPTAKPTGAPTEPPAAGSGPPETGPENSPTISPIPNSNDPNTSPQSPAPVVSPSFGTNAPVTNATPEPSGKPSNHFSEEPSFSAPPTQGPSNQPSNEPSISAPPTQGPSNQPSNEPSFSAPPTGLSDCLSTNTLKLGTAADNTTTPVPLDMSYNAESTSNSTDAFEAILVEELIRTAVLAIFGCNPETSGKIAPNTRQIVEATCEPALNGTNECFVLQTTFIILVEGPVDTDVATYESYSAIKKAMDDGGYTQVVPTVVSLEFLSPLPLIPPGNTSPSEQVDSDLQRTVDVSPWTIGFSVASVMGGFVSLLVYARSRKRRRALLDETTPWVSPNDDAAVI